MTVGLTILIGSSQEMHNSLNYIEDFSEFVAPYSHSIVPGGFDVTS